MSSFTQIAVIVVSGVFILFFISLFLFILYRTLNGKKFLVKIILGMQRKKLLKDDEILRYCVSRAEKDWTEEDVRAELLLTNKYKLARIEKVAYVYNIVKKELKGGVKNGAERKGSTKGEVSKDLPTN